MVIDCVSLVCLATGVSALPGESVSKPSVPFIKITVSLFPDVTPWHYLVSFFEKLVVEPLYPYWQYRGISAGKFELICAPRKAL